MPRRAAEMRAFLDLAVGTSTRLVSIESNDNALFAMSASLQQSRAQLASTEGRRDVAGLDANIARCAGGAPIGQFAQLE